jgi:hypothetical protein
VNFELCIHDASGWRYVDVELDVPPHILAIERYLDKIKTAPSLPRGSDFATLLARIRYGGKKRRAALRRLRAAGQRDEPRPRNCDKALKTFWERTCAEIRKRHGAGKDAKTILRER